MSAGEGSPPGERGAPVRVGRAVWLSAATMASRVLGLLREQLFAVLVGANRFSDAFVVAFRIPNLLRDLFAEGALSSAFVPAFADAHRNRGAEAAWRLANTVVALVLVVVGALTVLGALFAGPLVQTIAPGLKEPALATVLTRIMMPFLLLVSLSAAAMGMLNAQSRFTAPALAPALFNVGSLAVGVAVSSAVALGSGVAVSVGVSSGVGVSVAVPVAVGVSPRGGHLVHEGPLFQPGRTAARGMLEI